jgi:hypothetical protein
MIVPPILFALDQDGEFDVATTVRAIHQICRKPEREDRWHHERDFDRIGGQLQILIEAPGF